MSRTLGAVPPLIRVGVHADHAFPCMLGAELHLLAAGHAEARPCDALWVAAFVAHDVDHALPCMLGAKFTLSSVGHAQARHCCTL